LLAHFTPEAKIDFGFLVTLSESETIQKVSQARVVLWRRHLEKADVDRADQIVIISGWPSWKNSA
jgi:hypothetical protein